MAATPGERVDAAAFGRRYVEEFLDTGDVEVVETVLAEEDVAHLLGVEADRKEGGGRRSDTGV